MLGIYLVLAQGTTKPPPCPVCSSDDKRWYLSEYEKNVMENSMKYALCHFIIQGNFLIQNIFLILFWENRMVLETILEAKQNFP